jgi:hypothetical protein
MKTQVTSMAVSRRARRDDRRSRHVDLITRPVPVLAEQGLDIMGALRSLLELLIGPLPKSVRKTK